MKQRKHKYKKISQWEYEIIGINGRAITMAKSEFMAQRIARGLDLELEERRGSKR